jgi:hypothetical protein
VTALQLALGVLLVVIGVAGLLLPALPGAPLIFAGLLLTAWAEDFAYVGFGSLALLGALAALASGIDFVAGSVGAKRFGASPRAVLGAALGALAGIFFAPIGLVVGPFAGAVLAELTVKHDLESAQRAGFGAAVGVLLGGVAKLGIAFLMIGIFLGVRFFGAPA